MASEREESATGRESTDQPVSDANRIEREDAVLRINATWPTVGITRVDEESEAFVRDSVQTFETEVRQLAAELETSLKEDDEAEMPAMFPCELIITHEVTKPSERVVSLVWNIWSFTGGAHGQLVITANNYDQSNGFPLLLEDLFLDPNLAILQFTRLSRQKLAEHDDGAEGEAIPNDMLMAGTEPVEDNFRTFALLPHGIRLYFQPYQVAPWAAGPQTVDIDLDELTTAKPRLEYWQQAGS